jgi:BON domain
VKIRLPFRLAAAAGLWLSSLGLAQEQARFNAPQAMTGVPADQRLADAVAERLARSADLAGFQAEITVLHGTVELTGTAADAGQRAAILAAAKSVPGVKQVSDRLEVGSVQQAAGAQPGGPGMAPPPVALGPGAVVGGGAATDPFPVNGGPGVGMNLNPPTMPPYAWPTYAPYNNYSRVAYPEEYPHAAFPFIGPFYPFPKVPLGYRAIKLEWEDGHWWYGRTATKKDWWMVRYW